MAAKPRTPEHAPPLPDDGSEGARSGEGPEVNTSPRAEPKDVGYGPPHG
jgi:hypothetical protein